MIFYLVRALATYTTAMNGQTVLKFYQLNDTPQKAYSPPQGMNKFS